MANHNANMNEARNSKPATRLAKLPIEIQMMIMSELIPQFQDDDSLVDLSERDRFIDLRIGGVSIFEEIGEDERARKVRWQDTPSAVLDLGRADESLAAAATDVFWKNTTFSLSVELATRSFSDTDTIHVLHPALLRWGDIIPTNESDADLRERQLIHDIAPRIRRLVLDTFSLKWIRDWWSSKDSYARTYPQYRLHEVETIDWEFDTLDNEICERNGNRRDELIWKYSGDVHQRHDQIRKDENFACVQHLTLWTWGPESLAWRSPPRWTFEKNWGYHNVGLQLPLTSDSMMFAFRITKLFPALQKVQVLRDDQDSWLTAWSNEGYDGAYTHNPSIYGESRYGPEGKAEQLEQLLAHDKAVVEIFDMMIADREKAEDSQHSPRDRAAAFWDTAKVKIKAALEDEGARSS